MKAMTEAPVQQARENNPDNCLPLSATTNKKSLRRTIIARRDSIPDEIRLKKDAAIHSRLGELEAFKTSRATLFYAAFRSEVRTEQLVINSLTAGRITALPRVDKTGGILMLYKIGDWSDLSPGSWGILEPEESRTKEISINEIDMVLAPGVAFDVNCNRLGYGKGYYDKLLAGKKRMKPVVVGLAYEEQIADALPCNLHDMKMDMIITDKRIIACHEPKKD